MNKFIYFSIIFFLSLFGYSQVESVPVVGNDKNWVSTISYDLSGQTLSKGVSYFDVLGYAYKMGGKNLLFVFSCIILKSLPAPSAPPLR